MTFVIEIVNISAYCRGKGEKILKMTTVFLSVQTKDISESTGEMSFKFDIDIDAFAFKILHDEDKSGEVSKNWTGIIPSEGLGFSNGAKLGFGPPGFDAAVLKTEQVGSEIIIPIIYP